MRQSHIGDGGGGSSVCDSIGVNSGSDSCSDSEYKESNTKNRENKKKNKATQQYIPENNSRSTYDILSIDNDTMFDHVHPDNIIHNRRQSKHQFKLPDDMASRVYYTAIAGIGMYLLYKLMWKRVKR